MATKARSTAAPGKALSAKGMSLISNEKLKQIYSTMLKCRALEERAQQLNDRAQANGCCYVRSRREAAVVGCTIDLRVQDAIVSPSGDWITPFLKGAPLTRVVSELAASLVMTKQQGPSGIRNGSGKALPLGIQNAHLRVGVRAAQVYKSNKTGGIVVAFPAGPAEEDVILHHVLKTAGSHSLPMIFVVQSGATTFEGRKKQATKRLSTAAMRSYGLPGIPVDGNDAVAVYRVAYEAIERARRGSGPTLIECQTFVPEAPEMASSRVKKIVPENLSIDPIAHMEHYLEGKGLFEPSWKDQVVEQFSRQLDIASQVAGSLSGSLGQPS